MDIQPGQDVLQAFFAECEAKLVHFAPQNISNMLWACATLTVSPGTSCISILCMLVMHAAASRQWTALTSQASAVFRPIFRACLSFTVERKSYSLILLQGASF